MNDVPTRIELNRRNKLYYDAKSRILPELEIGQPVALQIPIEITTGTKE